MSRIEIIAQQAQWAHARTNKLLAGIPEELWYDKPDNINTSIAWQAGHLIISGYYNAIRVVAGSVEEAKRIFPIREYAITFGMGADPTAPGAVEPKAAEFKSQLLQLQQVAHEVLMSLKEEELDSELVATRMPHPIAHTKYEALMWDIQHESWHCGQISMIRRVLGNPTIFHSLKNKEAL